MTIKPFLKFAAASLLFACLGTARAATLTITPTTVTVAPGDVVLLEVIVDFEDALSLGGGFDVVYDPNSLQLLSWTANMIGDPGFIGEPDISDGLLSGIAFGNLQGMEGVFDVGTLAFQVVGGSSTVIGTETGAVEGPFLDAFTFEPLPTTYVGANINVVPVPAAAWLLFGALGTLLGFARKGT